MSIDAVPNLEVDVSAASSIYSWLHENAIQHVDAVSSAEQPIGGQVQRGKTLIDMPPVQEVGVATILIVDDSPEDRTAVQHFLSEAGAPEGLRFRFVESDTGEAGLAAYRSAAPDCILLDYHLPDMDGLEFLTHLKGRAAEVPIPVVLFTGSADRSLASAALRAGAQEYLPKRFMAPEMLLRAVQSAQNRFMLHTARWHIARELAETAERLRLTQEAAHIGTWDWKAGTEAVRWSEANFVLHGMAPSLGLVAYATWLAMIHPDDRDRTDAVIRAALMTGEEYEVEYRVILGDGTIRWLGGRGAVTTDEIGGPRCLLGVNVDITARHAHADELERRVSERTAAMIEESHRRLAAETLLLQAQKMEAIGQFTGVISHDFNNFLHVIVNSVNRAQEIVETEWPAEGVASVQATTVLKRMLNHATGAANSASQLTQQLLTFGRRQTLEPVELLMNHLVLGLVDMIQHTIGEAVVVETKLADSLWSVVADANQLEAALLNLIVNARDAMPSGGRLVIETGNVQMDEEFCSPPDSMPSGQYVMLSLTDTGSGIPADVLGRIFEPFFTTKPTGHGTGLGLAMVYGFVKQSGGHVRIASELGWGTTVNVYFPRLVKTNG